MDGSKAAYYVYMLLCSDDSLYTGITPDLQRRMRQHTGMVKGGAKYTALRPPKAIAALWQAPDKATAAKGEYAIKRLPPQQKRLLAAQPHQINEILSRDTPLALEALPTPVLEDVIGK